MIEVPANFSASRRAGDELVSDQAGEIVCR